MVINKRFIVTFTRSSLIFLCLSLPACGWLGRQEENNIKAIYRDLYLINVNDKELYNDVRIMGSLNIEYDQLENSAKKLDKNYDVILYCTDYACTESDRAAKLIRKLGFEKVLVYPGGIHEWYQLSLKDDKKYPIEGPATQKFLLRPLNRVNREEINSVSAEELSKLLTSRKVY